MRDRVISVPNQSNDNGGAGTGSITAFEIGRFSIPYTDLDRLDLSSLKRSRPVFINAVYGLDAIDRLQDVEARGAVAHVRLLFKGAEIHRVLRHLNMFDFFTFTLIPSEVSSEVYEEIYTFFMYSPMSSVCITWLTTLFAAPHPDSAGYTFDGFRPEEKYGACPGSCPLKMRRCSKPYLMTELYHPSRSLPSQEEFALFCLLELEYSQRMARDIMSLSDSELDMFARMRADHGIRSQYWLDPMLRNKSRKARALCKK